MRGFAADGEHRVIGKPAVPGFGSVLAAVIVAIALLSVSVGSLAQQQNGDLSQQMQLFNSLSPDQQQQLLQRLGNQGDHQNLGGTNGALGLGSLGANGGFNSGNNAQSILLQQLQLQQQRRLQSRLHKENGENGNLLNDENQIPVFKSGDMVLVELTLLPEAARASPAPPQTNSFQGNQLQPQQQQQQ
jgi:hypothetical protein